MRGARGLLLAVVLAAAGAGIGLTAVGRTWVREESRVSAPSADRPDAFVVTTTTRSGADLAPGARALALVSLAGAAAVVGTRGRGRQVVGLVLFAAGAGSALLAGRQLSGASTGAAAAAVVGGLLVAAAGGLAAARGAAWPGLGARYDAPASTAPRDVLADAWDATDRGEDPTDGDDEDPTIAAGTMTPPPGPRGAPA
ncbi:MAG TPA: Trp biosynthesis-associated membrane protein [Mycobacteriales bacterium]|nr:Trp biosynthesis-associated membrane protein [Mycobacteriales bacterium]